MPWTPGSFKKHNKQLTDQQAAKASQQANAILKSGGDEGTAIAVANKHASETKMRNKRYGKVDGE